MSLNWYWRQNYDRNSSVGLRAEAITQRLVGDKDHRYRIELRNDSLILHSPTFWKRRTVRAGLWTLGLSNHPIKKNLTMPAP